MGKVGAVLLLLAVFVFLLWTMSDVCVITSLCGGLAPQKQRANFPDRTAQNDTPQMTELANISTRPNETAEKISDEMGKPSKMLRNKTETAHTINNKGKWHVEKQMECNVTNAGSTTRNGSRITHLETEPIPGDKHIIFIETGCLLNKSQNSEYLGLVLHKRQVCAIESAAKMNPDYKVYLLYSCPIHNRLEDSSEYVQKIFTYPNVNLWKLETTRHFSKTPLEKWNFSAAIKTSLWPKEHASDVLRFLTLWKYGGTYLDMDFVILKSLDALGTNYVGLESADTAGSSVLSFAWDGMGHAVADSCVEELRANFRGDIWAHNGPGLVTRVLLKMCSFSRSCPMTTKARLTVAGCLMLALYAVVWFYVTGDAESRSLLGLGTNYVGAQSQEEIANGALNFDTDAAFRRPVHLCLMDVQKNFNGHLWTQNSPSVILRVLQILCGTNSVTNMTRQQCAGFAVLPPSVFYEITYPSWRLLFDESLNNATLKKSECSFGVHVWNRMSSKEKISVRSKQAYGLLAQKHCPRVYSNCGPEF